MFKPTLVTGAVYRAYGIEHPIGDPFGGPAYGLKEKGGIGGIFKAAIPIIAGAAMIIGSGGALAPMVIGGAMMAGGAMSGIGAISGNQTLSKIGNITSAVAGVAGMGYSVYSNWDSISNFFAAGTENAAAITGGAEGGVGAIADAGQAYTAPMSMSESADIIAEGTRAAELANASSAASFNPADVSGAYDTGAFAGELQNQINLAGQSPVSLPSGNMLASNATGVVDAGAAPMTMANTGFGTAQPFSGAPAALPGSTASFGSAGGATVGDTGGFVTGLQNAAEGSSGTGLLGSVGSFIKENPVVSLMGLQTLSGLAEGASPKSQAEGEYIQAMTDMKNAEQAYLEASKAPETAANTEYLKAKAAEFDKTKAYAEEKRAAYNASIAALAAPQTQNLAQTMYGGAQTGLINQARA